MNHSSLIFLIIALVVSPGNILAQKPLSKYKDVREIFTKAQIRELEKIIIFFNDAICTIKGVENSPPDECYHMYFERLLAEEETGNIHFGISHKQREHLFANIDSGLFNEIWTYGKSLDRKAESNAVINILHNGKYVKLLNTISAEDVKVHEYATKLQAAGGIAPSMIADVLYNYKQYDIVDERIKLLIAIHYITLSDHFDSSP